MTSIKVFILENRIFLTCLLVAFGILTFWSQFGFDFTDESFYGALAWRFVNGATPFVEEYGINQGYSWLLVPLAFLHKHLFSDFLGYVYFLRICFLIFHSCTSLAVYSYLKNVTTRSNSIFWAIFHQLIIPYSIAALSYNTMALDFLILSVIASQTLKRQFVTGILFFLTCLCFPPIAPLGLIFVFLFTHKGKGLKDFLVGCLGFSALTFSLLLLTGMGNIIESFRIHTSLNLQGKGVSFFFDHIYTVFIESIVAICILALIHTLKRFKKIPSVILGNRSLIYLLVVLSVNYEWFFY